MSGLKPKSQSRPRKLNGARRLGPASCACLDHYHVHPPSMTREAWLYWIISHPTQRRSVLLAGGWGALQVADGRVSARRPFVSLAGFGRTALIKVGGATVLGTCFTFLPASSKVVGCPVLCWAMLQRSRRGTDHFGHNDFPEVNH